MSRRRLRRSGLSPFAAGMVALIVISAGTYLGFAKDVPFLNQKFEIEAVFPSANSIRKGSPVRISGVNVGKVVATEPAGDDAARVRMEIDEDGLPIHADATAKIRPRIFLEGNFFVDLKPGTPGAPALDRGDTIKVTQTATPVQLDEVLTALQDDTREDLQAVLDEFSGALTDEPSAAQDRDADPIARGQTAAESLNDAAEDGAAALRSTAIVTEAMLGTEPEEDIQRMLSGLARATEGLGRSEGQLQELVSNLNHTMTAFASESTALRESIRELGPTLTTTNQTLGELNDAFPSVRRFANEIIPGVRETPATIEASFEWMEQTRRLLSRSELGGLARNLSPATRDLAVFVAEGKRLFPQGELVARCATDVILPTGDVVIKDEFETGQPNYREFLYAMVGLAGEGQNFDGNGMYVRFQPGGGSNTVSAGEQGSQIYGNAFPNVGTRPKMPPRKPPYNDDTDCFKSTKPDLNGPWAAKGEFQQATP